MNPHLKKTFVKAQINAYEALRSGLENFEREIPMNENCNLTPVLQAVMNDSVELFYKANCILVNLGFCFSSRRIKVKLITTKMFCQGFPQFDFGKNCEHK